MLRVLLQLRHRRFRRDLSAYLDGMLPQRARRRLEAHLDSCQACRQELAELRVTAEALSGLPMAEVPRSFALVAAPVAEVRSRPTARRLEFGLRLATATAAFALALVVIGDFAGLPGGGEKEMPAALQAAPVATPAPMERAPAETPAAEEAPTFMYANPVQTPAAEEASPAVGAAPVETPPTAMQAAPVATPAAEETPPAAVQAAPGETPAAIGAAPVETPPAAAAAPGETPAVAAPGIADTERGQPPTGAGVSEGQPPQEKTTEGAGVEGKAEPYAAEAQAAEKGGGLSREEAVRWLEIGLGAGVGILVILWAVARLQTSIGNRP
jgi:hypothetical protein